MAVCRAFLTVIAPYGSPVINTCMGIDKFAVKATLTILVVFVMLLLCFIGGLLIRIRRFKPFNERLEALLLTFIPDYEKVRAKIVKDELETCDPINTSL
jgi:hypothetical protein